MAGIAGGVESTGKGQLTLPKEVRVALGVRKGESLAFEVEDGWARARVIWKPASFADHEGVWRQGEGMIWEEGDAEIGELRGREDDGWVG